MNNTTRTEMVWAAALVCAMAFTHGVVCCATVYAAENREETRTIERAMKALEAAAPRAARDPTRPGFHLLPPAQFMNDINGGFYYRGWHHLLYTMIPWTDGYGSEHLVRGGTGHGWGHARSKDLIHWEHLPPALLPDEHTLSDQDASGHAFLDVYRDKPILFFAKTFYDERGRRRRPREQWAALPVDDELIRWRRVDIGLAPGRSGVPANVPGGWADMSVFQEAGRTFAIFKESGGLLVEARNEELTAWQAVGRIPHVDGECPNLFKLDGRYVLVRSTYPISYIVGEFCADDLAFRVGENRVRTLDCGYGPRRPSGLHRGLYGTRTFHDARGRSVLMGWVSGFKEGRGWNGCASLPRVLSLTDDDRLIQTPLPELAALRDRTSAWEGALDNAGRVLPGVSGDMLEVQARFRPGSARTVGLKLRPEGREDGAIALRLTGAELDVAGTRVPDALSADGTLKLHLFFDRSVLEVFIDGGRKSVTKVAYPLEGEDLVVEAFAEDGAAEVVSLAAWTMKSIWDDQSGENSP